MTKSLGMMKWHIKLAVIVLHIAYFLTVLLITGVGTNNVDDNNDAGVLANWCIATQSVEDSLGVFIMLCNSYVPEFYNTGGLLYLGRLVTLFNVGTTCAIFQ